MALPVDLSRTVAVVLVIFLHASIEPTHTVVYVGQGMQLWWASNVYDSISRTAVPLFVMLTGALLLQPNKADEPLRVFFKKRWNRIGIPVLFWGAVFFVWDFTVKGQPLTASLCSAGRTRGSIHSFLVCVHFGWVISYHAAGAGSGGS